MAEAQRSFLWVMRPYLLVILGLAMAVWGFERIWVAEKAVEQWDFHGFFGQEEMAEVWKRHRESLDACELAQAREKRIRADFDNAWERRNQTTFETAEGDRALSEVSALRQELEAAILDLNEQNENAYEATRKGWEVRNRWRTRTLWFGILMFSNGVLVTLIGLRSVLRRMFGKSIQGGSVGG